MFVKFYKQNCKQKTARIAQDFCKKTTYFRAFALSSALEDFTSVVGMGTGGALPV